MKLNILVAVLLVGFSLSYLLASGSVDFKSDDKAGIQFHKGTWAEALERGQKENKPIFPDVYDTWCGPCKKMKKKTFSNEMVGAFFNQHFINVAIDGETPEGRQLANQYSVMSYPSLLFVDDKGKVLEQSMGFHSIDEFLARGKTRVKI